jgi:hypothetical protein
MDQQIRTTGWKTLLRRESAGGDQISPDPHRESPSARGYNPRTPNSWRRNYPQLSKKFLNILILSTRWVPPAMETTSRSRATG